jgi:hypothetical protein
MARGASLATLVHDGIEHIIIIVYDDCIAVCYGV